ncbi:MAG: hypothetical protein ICV73_08210 [Acetobacteraceae bacterium]|nr:hypothetical protein [Acetobacteraceae bacterium]
MQTPSIRETLAFVRKAHGGAVVRGKPRWLRSMAVMNLLPVVLPGIKVTHEERQVALLRDLLRTTAETEASLLAAGFPEPVVASVLRLTRFDAGFAYLEHLRVVAESDDLAAKRVAMAALLREEQEGGDTPGEPDERRARRQKALALIRRGLGY